MRNLTELDRYRRMDRHVIENWGWAGDETCGMFTVPSPIDGKPINVVASQGEGWDHVSVSRQNRCPNWPEMEFIAAMFFAAGEYAMQLHVPAKDHVNNHPYCLHWWRPQQVSIPLPDAILVGIAALGVLTPKTAAQIRRTVNKAIAAKMASE